MNKNNLPECKKTVFECNMCPFRDGCKQRKEVQQHQTAVVEYVDTTVCRPKTKEIETVINAVYHAR